MALSGGRGREKWVHSHPAGTGARTPQGASPGAAKDGQPPHRGPPLAFEILARRRKHQAAEKLACPPELWRESGLVITSPTGGPVDPDWLTEAFQKHMQRLGLQPVTLHDLRHTHATLLIKNGEPIPTVSERLGHASRAITVSVYSHALPGAPKEAAPRLQRMFRAARKGHV